MFTLSRRSLLIVLALSVLIAFVHVLRQNPLIYRAWDTLWRRAQPSDFFRVLDINGNGEIDRFEWQSYYPWVNVYYDQAYTRERNDCNQDGIISWAEYYKGVMSSVACAADEQGILPHLGGDKDSYRGKYPVVLSDRQLQLIAQRDSKSLAAIVRKSFEEIPHPGREEILPLSEAKDVIFECRAAVQMPLDMPLADGLNATTAQAMQCELSNNLTKYDLTLIVASIDFELENESLDATIAKAVFVPAGSTDTLTALVPATGQIRSMRLRLVGGIGRAP